MGISRETFFMSEALKEAALAADAGEVPVGAVCVYNDIVVSRAHNLVETLHDASAHAEILAMREAAKIIGDWRLYSVSLYVTLEPCTMCIGAMVLSRIKELYFGAYDPRQGAVGSLYDLSNHSELPHQIKVVPGVMREECEKVLSSFFEGIRNGKN